MFFFVCFSLDQISILAGSLTSSLSRVIARSFLSKLALCLREIPLELRQRSRGGQVNLDMEDHRDEDFAKPKPAFKAFTGEGQKLGR